MGNCSNQFMESKRSASENLDALFQKPQQKSPILFIVKEWPSRYSINLRHPAEAATRNLDLFLYPGEKIEITLKNHQRESISNLSTAESNGRTSVVSSKNGLHCEIRRNNQFYQICFPLEKERESLWRYIRGWTDFSEGDIMKMGATKYKLNKFVTEHNYELEDLKRTIHKTSNIQESAARCRICLSSIDTPENPFICPCKCQGSIKLTHLQCLAAWLFSSSLNQNQFLIVKINKTICELCGTDIMDSPEFKKMENLLLTNLHDIPAPYGIFECFHQEENKSVKNYLVLCFKMKKSYTLGRTTFGRGEAADISENDIHISKINTEMRYSNDRLSIRDRESLHGTLLQVRQPIRIYKSNTTEELVFNNMLFKIVYDPNLEQTELDVLPEINQNPSTKVL